MEIAARVGAVDVKNFWQYLEDVPGVISRLLTQER
jgi:hypothetical protein